MATNIVNTWIETEDKKLTEKIRHQKLEESPSHEEEVPRQNSPAPLA